MATCVSQIMLDAQRPLDSTTSHGDTFQNIVITSIFLLIAFGVPRSQALASAVKPKREVSSVASGSNALHGWPCPFDWYCDDKIPAGLDDECVDALLILFAAKMEI